MVGLSHIFSQMLKSVGGITYTRNRYASIVGRARVHPVNPNTAFQNNIRSIFASSVKGWMGLDEIQRQKWTDYASNTPWVGPLGESVRLTGQAMYICVRSVVKHADPTIADSVFDIAPEPPGLMALPRTVTGPPLTGTGAEIAIYNDDPVASVKAQLYLSVALPPSRKYWKGPYDPLRILLSPVIAAGDSENLSYLDLTKDLRYHYKVRFYKSSAPHVISSEAYGSFIASEAV